MDVRLVMFKESGDRKEFPLGEEDVTEFDCLIFHFNKFNPKLYLKKNQFN